jgi:uncharacterized protein YbbC (DUF1343 family)
MIATMKKQLLYIFKFFRYLITVFIFTNRVYSSDTLSIKPGAFQMEAYIYKLQNKKVGVVVNTGSVIGSTNLIDTLLSSNIKIEMIFSPEHGFSSNTAAGESVKNEIYGKNHIPVTSLYGTSKKPSKAEMKSVDILVFDLQDVGVRFYTYISTLQYVMEACAENGKPLIVLDRPNPNGFYIDGPVLEEKFKSFVGLDPVPIVYGMTIGEYAQMINGENWLHNSLKCEITVVKCKNYDHNSYYELPVNPSPNLRDMKAVYYYPTIALFEGTVVSEGRGTDLPFLVSGHPDYPDHSFSFVPGIKKGAGSNPKLLGQICYGIDLHNNSLDSLRSLRRINLKIILDFYKSLKKGEQFFTGYFDTLAGTDNLRKMILEGKNETEIRNSWKTGLDNFKKIRAKYLLYPDFSY